MSYCSVKNGIIKKAKSLLASGMTAEAVNNLFGEKLIAESNPQEVSYDLTATKALLSDKAIRLFDSLNKNKVSGEQFWKKVQSDLQIPKEQLELLKSFGTSDRVELVTSLLANYSYAVEINTAKSVKAGAYAATGSDESFSFNNNEYGVNLDLDENYDIIGRGYTKNNKKISKTEYDKAFQEANNNLVPTQHYSNLTVPGGTNYTENEIATPAIAPSIQSHAAFKTENGVGWFRSDDKQSYNEQDIDTLIDNMKNSGVLEINCS